MSCACTPRGSPLQCSCAAATAMEPGSTTPDLAPCPVCNRSFSLQSINSHIDLCLFVAEQKEKGLRDTLPAPLASPTPPAPQQNSGGRKRSSPASSGGKQSVLGFKRGESPGGCVSQTQPPAKSRKLTLTPDGYSYGPAHIATSSGAKSSDEVTGLATPKEEVSVKALATQSVSGELSAPLAEVMRPTNIEEYVGQEGVIGQNAILHSILESGQVPSLIFWGPPGCGKTTLARIIARVAREKCGTRFTQLSATTSGVSDVKEAVKVARNERAMFKRRTILFIDEIHRFNKLQQDTFLPHVEDGTITLLGATTENPSFQLNSALLSRCRVIVLQKLQPPEIESLLRRALAKVGAVEKVEKLCAAGNDGDHACSSVSVEPEAIAALALFCDGDARSALNGLQIAVQAQKTRARQSSSDSPSPLVTVEVAKESLQRTHLLYDRAGEEHYNIISALHKSMRGSDTNASLYWLARMLCAGEDPLYVARRVVRFASEDIGLADPNALCLAVSTFQACQFIGMPECEVNLAQAVVYMARAPKSIEVYSAYSKAKQSVKEHRGPLPSVPLHLRNAPTKLMKKLGYGSGYKYNPAFSEMVDQQYMPEGMEDVNFIS